MKILIVGEWTNLVYEDAFKIGLNNLGVEVTKFSTNKYLKNPLGKISSIIPLEPITLYRINKNLLRIIKAQKPQFVMFWRTTQILPITINAIKNLKIKTIFYNNDDPFGPKSHKFAPWHHHFLWLWYLRCIKISDYNFFYRKINCKEALSHGCKNANLLLPYFLPWRDKPIKIENAEKDLYETDIVFIGHYENDGREKSIDKILSLGYKFKIWGDPSWKYSKIFKKYKPIKNIQLVSGNEYAKAICGSKICLAFLSKLNRDTYTRRCFEIPACGKLLLCERTDDLKNFFKEDFEACYFSNTDELIDKINWLLNNPEILNNIAERGHKKVWKLKTDIFSITEDFLKKIN